MQHWSTQCFRMCRIHGNVAQTTKAATSVLKCKRKPTRQSLSLESSALKASTHQQNSCCFLCCRRLFSSQRFFFFIHTVPPENGVCVSACAPHWGIKWQAGSIRTDLSVRWRDSIECFWMCWRFARAIKALQNKSQGMKVLVWWTPRGRSCLWGSHAMLPHNVCYYYAYTAIGKLSIRCCLV